MESKAFETPLMENVALEPSQPSKLEHQSWEETLVFGVDFSRHSIAP